MKTVFKKFSTHKVARLAATALLLTATATPLLGGVASAAQLGTVMVRFDRMSTSTATTGTVCATTSATNGTEGKVMVTFPTGYTLGTAANFTVGTTNTGWPTGATAWPGIATASAVSGQQVTFASNDLTVSTQYCFNWTNSAAVTTKSTASNSNAGAVETQTAAAATIDNGSYSTATISNDQVVVTASVPQTFSFSLSGNTDAIGALSTSSPSTGATPRVATINTNAKNGWMLWAKGSGGLTSSAASYTISSTAGSASTLAANTQGYNTGITTSQAGGSGTISVISAYNGSTQYAGAGLDTTLRTLATSNGTADTAAITLKNNASINNLTPAATDYTDTITVVAAGLF